MFSKRKPSDKKSVQIPNFSEHISTLLQVGFSDLKDDPKQKLNLVNLFWEGNNIKVIFPSTARQDIPLAKLTKKEKEEVEREFNTWIKKESKGEVEEEFNSLDKKENKEEIEEPNYFTALFTIDTRTGEVLKSKETAKEIERLEKLYPAVIAEIYQSAKEGRDLAKLVFERVHFYHPK
jgi:hypothetical protein